MVQPFDKWVPVPLAWPVRAVLDGLQVMLIFTGLMTLIGEEWIGEEWPRRSYLIFGGLAVLWCLGKEAYLIRRKGDA